MCLTLLIVHLLRSLYLNRSCDFGLVAMLTLFWAGTMILLIYLNDCKFSTFANFGGIVGAIFLKSVILNYLSSTDQFLLICLNQICSLRPSARLFRKLHDFLGKQGAGGRTLYGSLSKALSI